MVTYVCDLCSTENNSHLACTSQSVRSFPLNGHRNSTRHMIILFSFTNKDISQRKFMWFAHDHLPRKWQSELAPIDSGVQCLTHKTPHGQEINVFSNIVYTLWTHQILLIWLYTAFKTTCSNHGSLIFLKTSSLRYHWYKILHVFTAHNLMSLALCVHSWKHHFQDNKHVHHLQEFPGAPHSFFCVWLKTMQKSI